MNKIHLYCPKGYIIGLNIIYARLNNNCIAASIQKLLNIYLSKSNITAHANSEIMLVIGAEGKQALGVVGTDTFTFEEFADLLADVFQLEIEIHDKRKPSEVKYV